MYFSYGRAGLYADVALSLNMLLIFGVSGLGAVLTLPGIAGIVLTIGMSVDANVLILKKSEKFTEKRDKSKRLLTDSVMHYRPCWMQMLPLVLLLLFFILVLDQLKFATTLLIGILTSLFTAIFITRMLVEWYISSGKKLEFSTPLLKFIEKSIHIFSE